MTTSLERRAARTPRIRIRKGRIYWEPSASLRREGYAAKAIGPLSSPNLNKADELNAAADAFLNTAADARPAGGTTAAVIEKYKAHADYTNGLSQRTQRDRDRHLNRVKLRFGETLIEQLTTLEVEAWHDDMSQTSAEDARNSLAALRAFLTWAVRRGYAGTNAALGVKAAAAKKRKRIATRDELWAIVTAAEKMGRLSIASAAITEVATMQRVDDTLSLTTSQIKDGVLYMTQSKTKAELSFRLHPLAIDRLGPLPERPAPLFVNEHTKQRYSLRSFERAWSEVRARAAEDMPSLTGADATVLEPVFKGALCARDLRRTGMVWAAEAGASIVQICAVSGHTLQSGYDILEHYLPRQRIFADQTVAKLDMIRSPALEEIKRHMIAS